MSAANTPRSAVGLGVSAVVVALGLAAGYLFSKPAAVKPPEPAKPVEVAKVTPADDKPAPVPTPVTLVRVNAAPALAAKAGSTDHTMFGGTNDRNMVNTKDTGIVEKPDPEQPTWKAELGSRAYGGPTIAGGKVFVGTNNEKPRNPRDQKKNADGDVEPIDKGVLMSFAEKDGAFLWQAIHDKLPSGQVHDWPKEGICSTPLVEGNRVYYVSNRCTVVCADVDGMANGNDGVQTEKYKDKSDADVIWEFDMMAELGVFPHNMAAASPMIVGDLLFLVTANGVDEGHLNIPAPEAPSFLALKKADGKVAWKSNLPGKDIMHGQWSNPVLAEVKGKQQIIFPGGDGWLYGLDPADGKVIWKFDANPKDSVYELGGQGTRNDFIGTPVVHDNKVFIGVGQDPEHFTGIGHFYCIDPTKTGDISPELPADKPSADPKTPAPGKPNPNSGAVWHYGGADKRKFVQRDFSFGRTMSTACIIDGVLYISELQGFLHCLDAKTGKKYWQYDTKGAIWGSPYYVDGKVFLATEGGEMFVFKHVKQPKVIDELDIPDATDDRDYRKKMLAKRKDVEKEYLLAKVEFPAPIRSTPVVANGVLYVMTESALYAFKK